MSKYAKRMREGSSPYRMGRLDRKVRKWNTPEDQAEYERGLRDLHLLKRRNKLRSFFNALWQIPVGIFALLGTFVGFAFLSALPLIIVLLIVKVLFF